MGLVTHKDVPLVPYTYFYFTFVLFTSNFISSRYGRKRPGEKDRAGREREYF